MAVVERLATEIEEADAIFAVDYRGISVPQAAELRTKLRDADAKFSVVKNSLTERAADQAGAGGLRDFLDGPTALTFVRGDAAAAAKALRDTARATNLLEFKGGWMGGSALTAADIDSIARLPSRQVLYGQLVGVVASPITGVVRSLNQLIAGFAQQLQQIADQGLVTGSAPAATAAPAAESPAEEQPSEDAVVDSQEAAEQPSDDPDAEPHDAPAQPDQAEGDENPTETQEDN